MGAGAAQVIAGLTLVTVNVATALVTEPKVFATTTS
jgi:hypothetical protein